MGLRAYAYLLERRGEKAMAKALIKAAKNFTNIWWEDSMVREVGKCVRYISKVNTI